MELWVLSVELQASDHASDVSPCLVLKWYLTSLLAAVTNEAEGAHAEAVDVAVRPRDAVGGEGPMIVCNVDGFWPKKSQAVSPCGISWSARGYRIPVVNTSSLTNKGNDETNLHGVNEVRELDCILKEEHQNVVSNNIVVPLVCIEPHGKSMDITHKVPLPNYL